MPVRCLILSAQRHNLTIPFELKVQHHTSTSTPTIHSEEIEPLAKHLIDILEVLLPRDEVNRTILARPDCARVLPDIEVVCELVLGVGANELHRVHVSRSSLRTSGGRCAYISIWT
jgi:hypothetical protein